MCKTDTALAVFNKQRGLTYPDIGYSYYADVTGDGRRPFRRSIYTIVNVGGGIVYSHMNDKSHTKRLAKINKEVGQ